MNSSVLRIIDANLNRAREALRVVEDYARFVLDDADLQRELKELRHVLAGATAQIVGQAILFRDTAGDVGTGSKTGAEVSRANLSEVVTAAGKRLGEALRTIEEYLKIESPTDAATVEQVRYRFYDLETRIARTFRGAERFADVSLYVLITESACRRPWREVARVAIDGGADCLQLREKSLESGELLARARELVEMARPRGVKIIINDRPDIAVLSGADGVHVGQQDLSAIEARKIVGKDRIVGVSTHNLEQARQARLDGADYIGVGPVFVSPTKPRDFLPGLDYARQAAAEIGLPSIAIAGITPENLDQVLETGVSGVAVTAAVSGSEDVQGVVAGMKRRISEMKAVKRT